MTAREQLLALADRAEQATGADRELDAAIAAAVRYFPSGVGFVWQYALTPNVPEPGRVECCTSLGTGGPHYKARAYTASLDVAVSLVPEGHEWAAGTGCAQHMTENGRKPWAWCVSSEGFAMVEQLSIAATPALALTAAALRARANTGDAS